MTTSDASSRNRTCLNPVPTREFPARLWAVIGTATVLVASCAYYIIYCSLVGDADRFF
jgi:hypothetical protein